MDAECSGRVETGCGPLRDSGERGGLGDRPRVKRGRAAGGSALAARDGGSRWPRRVPLFGGHLPDLSSFLEDHGFRWLNGMKTESRSASGGEAMSERWLLYDAGCSVCAALAREVETLSGGRLRVRNLRDPEVQARLDRARPGWRWEPMLLEIEGERVRVFTGLGMRARLVQVLGPVRALQVAQAVAQMGGPVLGVDWGRRRLLRQSLALAGLALLRRIPGGLQPSGPVESTVPVPQAPEGEQWEGFLLLPPGAPLPSFVRQVLTPILCQTDGSPEAEALRGEVLTFPDLEQLRPFIRFPLYRPSRLPPGIKWQCAAVTRFARSGEVFSVSLNFEDGEGMPRIRVIAQPMYPSPYPVWPVYSPDRPEELIFPEKVFFTPRPGLLLPSAQGHLALWIEQNTLYMLIAEHDTRLEANVELIKSLNYP